MKNLKNLKNNEILIAPLITFFVLLAVFAFKHIYPFGSLTVDQYGMTEVHLPMYAHTWDVFHGKASLYYDWYTGAGSDIFAGLGFYIISPFNLFFLFVGRDRLLESMSVFLTLKLMFAAASQAFYLKKEYGHNAVQNTVIALFYAFCGYTVQQYASIFYLDAVIFFPLLMYALKRMIKTRKGFVYMFISALMLISNPYLGAMSLIFIVFYTAGYLFFEEDKKDEKRRITAQLGQYTLIALLLSMAVVCPAVFKWLRSARMELIMRAGYTDLLKSTDNPLQGSKLFMLCGTEAGFAALIAVCSRLKVLNKRETRKLSFNIYLIALLMLPIAVTSIDYLWNFGSDTGIPMRCGFILTFVLLDFYKYISEDGLFVVSVKKEQQRLAWFTAAVMLGVFAVMFVLLSKQADLNAFNLSGKVLYLPVFASAVLFLCIIAGTENIKAKNIALLAFAILHCVLISASFISPKGYENAITENYKTCAQFKNSLGLQNDRLSRIKTLNPAFSANYPLVMELPSLSTKTNEASKEYIKQMQIMGYTCLDEKVSDTGGTAFSDALMNVKYVISANKLDPALYEKERSVGRYNVYKCKYTLPFGMIVPHRFTNTSFSKYGLDNQNLIYGSLWNFTDPLIEVQSGEQLLEKETTEVYPYDSTTYFCNVKFDIKGEKTLYVNMNEDAYETYEFSVNGSPVLLSYENIDTAYTYPSVYNNGIAEIGTYKDETIELEIKTKDAGLKGIKVGLMDTLKLKALARRYKESCAEVVSVGKNDIRLSADTAGGDVVLIPVEFSENWKAEINGNSADIFPLMNSAFMGVILPEGPADIHLTYVPVQLYAGLILSMIGLLFVFWSYVRIKEDLDWANAKILRFVTYPLFWLTAAAMLTVMYIVPLAAYILKLLNII